MIKAAGGAAALEAYRAQGDAIALVILDLRMPGMSGVETFGGLMTLDPDVRVLIASGYPEEAGVGELLASGARGFLPEPFSLQMLSQEAARVLEIAPAGDG